MSHFQAQTATECLSLWCGLTVGHTEPHNDIRIQRSASRTEAAAWVYGDEIGDCSSYDAMSTALAAADAHDAAHGIHRVTLDDATVERAARALLPVAWDLEQFWFRCHGESIGEARARYQKLACDRVRAVQAAAVEAGHE